MRGCPGYLWTASVEGSSPRAFRSRSGGASLSRSSSAKKRRKACSSSHGGKPACARWICASVFSPSFHSSHARPILAKNTGFNGLLVGRGEQREHARFVERED